MLKIVQVPKPIRFTREGYNEVKNKYEMLKKSRPAAVATLARARAMGDLSENGFYKAAKGKLTSIDSEIAKLEHFIKFGVIQKKKKAAVDIGSKVIVKSNDKKIKFQIVGDLEANPRENKISLNSPIGKALSGKKTGDSVIVHTPSGKILYQISATK